MFDFEIIVGLGDLKDLCSSDNSKMEQYLVLLLEMERKREEARAEERRQDRIDAKERWEREMELAKMKMEQDRQFMLMNFCKSTTKEE